MSTPVSNDSFFAVVESSNAFSGSISGAAHSTWIQLNVNACVERFIFCSGRIIKCILWIDIWRSAFDLDSAQCQRLCRTIHFLQWSNHQMHSLDRYLAQRIRLGFSSMSTPVSNDSFFAVVESSNA